MIEDKKQKHRNKLNRMRDAEIMGYYLVPFWWFLQFQALLQG